MRAFRNIAISTLATLSVSSFAQKPFDFQGQYVEGCACPISCGCDLKGMMASGCNVIGAITISKGYYGSANLAGCQVSYIASSGWTKIYFHVGNKEQAQPLTDFINAYFTGYGKIASMQASQIDITRGADNIVLTVDGGKIAKVEVAPIMGIDGKTPVMYTNYPDPLFSKIAQGKTLQGSFSADGQSFSLKDSNAFLNLKWSASGKI